MMEDSFIHIFMNLPTTNIQHIWVHDVHVCTNSN